MLVDGKVIWMNVFSLFWLQKSQRQYSSFVKLIAYTNFCFFTFLLMKIVTPEQLWQQLIRPVVHTCFRLSFCKNCNMETTAALSGRSHKPIFSFKLLKIVIPGQLCQHLVKPITSIYYLLVYLLKLWGKSSYATSWLDRLYIRVFTFLLIKNATQGHELCQPGQTMRAKRYIYNKNKQMY